MARRRLEPPVLVVDEEVAACVASAPAAAVPIGTFVCKFESEEIEEVIDENKVGAISALMIQKIRPIAPKITNNNMLSPQPILNADPTATRLTDTLSWDG